MKQRKTLLKEAFKKHPHLKGLIPYAYYPWEWLLLQEGLLTKAINERDYSSLKEELALAKQYSKVSYCKHQYDYWPSVEDFTYADSIESDIDGLFRTFSEEAREIMRKDLALLREFEKTADKTLLIGNCFI